MYIYVWYVFALKDELFHGCLLGNRNVDCMHAVLWHVPFTVACVCTSCNLGFVSCGMCFHFL